MNGLPLKKTDNLESELDVELCNRVVISFGRIILIFCFVNERKLKTYRYEIKILALRNMEIV